MRGCLLRIAIAVAVLVALFFAIGLAFDQDGESPSRASDYNAGPAEEYARSDVTYIAAKHVYVVRLAGGSFVALYDKSPKQQEVRSDCRILFDERAQLGPLEQLDGFRGGFVEECEGTRAVWRADGQRAFGAGYGNLDRFKTRIDANSDLIVDLSERTCTRSSGVAGVPPFVETTCKGAG
jgi:hypothetical protein